MAERHPLYACDHTAMPQPPAQLVDLIAQHSIQVVSPAVRALTDGLLHRHGSAVQAILFYGSCLRTGTDDEGIVDLYVLVDSYRSVYRQWIKGFLNRLLPPNVFYLELPFQGRVVRAKYAVISLRDFQRGTSMRWFHSYLWGRFAQPTRLLYARNDHIARQVRSALAQAVTTFISRVLPQLPSDFNSRNLWCTGLSLSYRAELRAERREGIGLLVDNAPAYYEELTYAAMVAIPFSVVADTHVYPIRYHTSIPTWRRYHGRWAWIARQIQGKLLSFLRLLKGLFTFEGGVDYIAWKLERHSGVKIEVTPQLRRHPLIVGWGVFWRLYRQRVFR